MTTNEAAGSGVDTNRAAVLDVPRDPFWPVGFVPKPDVPEVKVVEKPKPPPAPPIKADWPRLKFRGVTESKEGKSLAILEGVGVVEPGQIVAIESKGLIYTWKIMDIADGRVAHMRLDVSRKAALPSVPRRRPPLLLER